MRNRTRIKIAFDMCINEGWLFLLGMAVSVVAFAMLGWVIQMFATANSYVNRVQSALRVPTENVGFLSIDAGIDVEKEISADISGLKEIELIGYAQYWMSSTNEAILFLGEIQKGHQKSIRNEEYAVGKTIETCVLSKGAWEMMNLKLSSGKNPNEFSFEDNTRLLYLSDEYKSVVELGQHFYEISEKDGSVLYDFVVAGFLSKDSRMLADGVGNSTDETVERGYYSTEYAIIEVNDSPFFDGGYFSIRNGESFDKVKDKIIEIGKHYNTEISINKLDSVLRYASERTRTVSKYMLELNVLLAAAAMILLVSIQIGRVASRAEEYGIWLTNGASMSDIMLIIFYQNIIYIFPAMIFGLAIVYRITLMLIFDAAGTDFLREMLWRVDFPLLLLVGILVTVVISLIPVRLLSKSGTVSLVKGEID